MVDLIAFDADDTLWHNEPIFQATEAQFAQLLSAYHPPEWVRERLFATEMKNLGHFGYGIKGFILSMIETALDLTESRIGGAEVRRIVEWGHDMLRQPVQLLDGVRETVEALSGRYRLMLLTKGDLFDQESKLARSGLGEFFSAVEIVSTKNASIYRAIMMRHAIVPDRFVMVGNSLRSDVLPALEAGALAVHIPYEMTWAHEHLDEETLAGKEFAVLERITALPEWLRER
ncbi:MAG TPA: HAD family hydrolase [Thermoanaerobaculia bacterium]|jgi:putative hydrolase of the HAD superfamily|nr:HAD family hydrolase [Thermoanaerobaculia bacterium]